MDAIGGFARYAWFKRWAPMRQVSYILGPGIKVGLSELQNLARRRGRMRVLVLPLGHELITNRARAGLLSANVTGRLHPLFLRGLLRGPDRRRRCCWGSA